MSVLIAIQLLAALILIALIASQTSKQEGMGGVIGGQTSSAFGGKSMWEHQLDKFTRYIAIGFFAISFLISVLGG